jgi:uncharacterized repeat protein (TIGR03803 family)
MCSARVVMSRFWASTFVTFCVAAMLMHPAQAQTYTVIHNFLGGADGDEAAYGMTIDPSGTLYGSTFDGDAGTGTIYSIRYHNGFWQLSPLYVFTGGAGSPGAVPYAGVIFGPNGALYGTTGYGGIGSCATWGGTTGCGTVFELQPHVNRCINATCYWIETPLFDFNGTTQGATPYGARPIFDQAGNIYGTAFGGGTGNCSGGCGLVYELTPSNGSWTEKVLYNFAGNGDGAHPWSGVIFDQVGNIYGTTELGGANGFGTVYKLSPSGSGWTETVLYNFQNQQDGSYPFSGLLFDGAGNLYGATTGGGTSAGGTVYELSPNGSSWTFQTIAAFTREPGELAGGPVSNLLMDSSGNIYGATYGDGAFGTGSVFKLTNTGNGWTNTDLHDFDGNMYGVLPRSNLVMDASGNLYGMVASGGEYGMGAIFELTP